MEFSRQESWSGLPFSPPLLPDPGIEPGAPTLQAHSLPSESPGKRFIDGYPVNEKENLEMEVIFAAISVNNVIEALGIDCWGRAFESHLH